MQRWSKQTNDTVEVKVELSAWHNVVFTQRLSRCHFALFLSHNCIIFSVLSPSLAAFSQTFCQLLRY